jgi:hypothetical protein
MYTENIYSKFYTEHLMAQNTGHILEYLYTYKYKGGVDVDSIL